MSSFENALTDMVKIPETVSYDLIKDKGESVDTKSLKSIILRYHQPLKKIIYLKRDRL